ncbi:MAG: M23 family metallopeptidase [Vicinamibacterales bacterium]
MRQATILATATAAVLAGLAGVAWHLAAAEPEPAAPARVADVELPRDAELISARVPSRTTLVSVLESHAVPADEIHAIISSASREFDLRRFRAGQPYRLDQLLDGHVRGFEYEIDGDHVLRLLRHEGGDAPAFDVAIADIPKTYETTVVEGTIDRETPSLVQALEASGERIDLGLAMADVFAGEIDFNNDLQPGDSFRLVVERATREDGAFAGYGPVRAAEFVNAGRSLRAIRFTPPGGKPGYYDEQGRSLKRLFLKSPLKFEPTITSSYSRARRHPVLKITRAHHGVDYRAPYGAPVVSVSSGVVSYAGWTTGGGRTVRVRHASGYESEYMHLSAIGVRRGARVAQGEVIGKVGNSGMVTATHLHYGLRKNGSYVNPVTEHRNMPPGEPVAKAYLAVFHAERDQVFGLLFSDTGVRTTN